jgi:mono/diheme cytochrome c family protein
VRVATAVAGALAVAAVVMAVLAFTAGDESDERAAAPPTATPAASSGERDGLDVWAEQGCGSCHTLAAANAHGFLGPDLESSLEGVPASYIKDSIVAPDKAVAAGFPAGMMPDDYASRISPEDLDRLVSFLQQSARR